MRNERHHATLFVDPAVASPVEELRRTWDPEMARQIAAHATLVYPWEAPDPAMIDSWIRGVAPDQPPFRLRLGRLARFESEQGVGCGFIVEDVDGGHAGLRRRITAATFTPGDVEPHVTIVHPRTSRLGQEAWTALEATRIDLEFWVRAVSITAWDGDRWPTLQEYALGRPR